MNKTLTRCFGILALTLFAFAASVNAQTAYKLGKGSTLTLAGTSTLHNWTMTATSFTCPAQFAVSPAGVIGSVNALALSLPVHNLKSEHDGMNDNAYDALKADKYKDISFKLVSGTPMASGGNKYQIAAQGNLTIAGVTKPITVTTTGVVNSDGSITCTGSVPIKLSEYGIERPTFMFGTMSVGDAMTLTYTLVFVN
jgi:polyisoprenoid-binding protein YceI